MRERVHPGRLWALRPALLLMATVSLVLASLTAGCGKRAGQPDKYSFYERVVDSSKPLAWGDDRDIFVFCDDGVWKLTENMLRQSLERETAVVVNERFFNLKRADIGKMDEMSKYKNLLFLGSMKGKGAVSEHMRRTMDKRMTEQVQRSGAEIFVTRNRWVRDQLVVYVVGSDLENLLKINILQANRLYEMFLNRLGERLAYQAYQTKVIPERFFEPFPFTMKIPENFRLFQDSRKDRFLSFLYRIRSESRDFPDKYISVYYEDMPQQNLTLDWLIKKRKELAYRYYDGDEFDEKLLRSERVKFGNYSAWKISGPWVNKKHDIGGGFQAFGFYDEQQGRAYLIDNAVYFPAGDKLPVLLELQKISSTFRTK